MAVIQLMYRLLWGDLITIPLPGGSSLGLSLLILILVPSGIYFTVKTGFLPFRLFHKMLKVTTEKRNKEKKDSISGVQALIISTATRVGMGNLVGVVAAISAGGAGAVFWMWVMALLGSSTAFVEATLAQLYKEKDPLYGGFRGGPAYYIHALFKKTTDKKKHSIIAVLFAISGLICWCGISQVIGNSVSSSFKNAFQIPPLYTTIFLVLIAAVIVLRKNATVKVLDFIVPVMAGLYFLFTLIIIGINFNQLPGVFRQIFEEACGCGRLWRRADEWSKKRFILQRGWLRLCSLRGRGSRYQPSCQGRTFTILWRFYRHNCDLQLFRDDNADDSCWSDTGS